MQSGGLGVTLLLLAVGLLPASRPVGSVSAEAQGVANRSFLHVSQDTSIEIGFEGVEEHDRQGILSVYAHDLNPRDGVALIQFDSSALDELPTIESATLELFSTANLLQPGQPIGSLSASRVTTPWKEGELTGPEPPRWTRGPSIRPERRGGIWFEWNISRIVQEWQRGSSDYGLVIQSSHGLGDHLYYRFSSSESNRPPLIELRFGNAVDWLVFLPELNRRQPSTVR